MTEAVTEAARTLAARLIDARERGQRIAPQDRPDGITEADAYRVQALVAERFGPVGGYKVGCTPGKPPIMAPIHARDVLADGARLEVPGDEPIGIELEIGFRLVAPLPPADAPGRAVRARECIEAVPVIEIVRSRLSAPQQAAPLLKLADNQINGGLVVGTPVRDWSGLELARPSARLRLGDEVVLDGRAEVPGGDAFANFLALADLVGGHCGGLTPGQVVITGSLNGVPWVRAPLAVAAEIDGLGAVALELVPR
ncbi:2-keto-4-pentenoate hydratase [Rhodobacteraceae bacterium 2CG4]|uniref:2-keto-4-pentenoate hydratase n=1 Tax=Halovulum marinum TaxID=2662447 RepID=A0A6L5Z3R0_9RHOB|nr:2-keto-4-pentenoate hydratase [Halovulum marinum]MSU91231.1 2-keto-4-pentenoate hydratase [Halovulum marinum]